MLEQVADRVLVHQSALLQNNTVVVQGGAGVLLVDAGITEAELRCLGEDLRALGQDVVAGFSTHPDWDHALWHPGLGEVRRWGTARCAAFLEEQLAEPGWEARVREGLPPEIVDETPLDRYGRVTPLPAGADHLPWDGPGIRVIEHPAHAPGHAALLLEDSGVLVAGDMLSDLFVPMLDEFYGSNDPVAGYLAGLRILEDVADEVEVVVPGHGSVGRGGEVRSRIDRDRSYVEALRDRRDPADPRVESPAPGWEWVSDIHHGQVQRLGS